MLLLVETHFFVSNIHKKSG